MFYKWLLMLKKPSNQLWITPSYWTIVTILFVFLLRLGAQIPDKNILPGIPDKVLHDLLNIIASSMLAVTTFSLSIMVSAYSAVTNGATPRAIDLVVDDQSTRTAISSFICAFIYAIIAKTALSMGFYEQNGHFVLFISTVAVLIYLIITLIKWVYTLSQLGRLGNTLTKIENATRLSLENHWNSPTMGATSNVDMISKNLPTYAEFTGYLTHINMQTLQKLAENHDCNLHINVRPGELITPHTILYYAEKTIPDDKAFKACFIHSTERTFEQDPSWGFIVLSEVAQRALSPAVNDPGTAINVMTRMMSLLSEKVTPQEDKPDYNRLSIKPFDYGKLIRNGFWPIARDGINIIEVNLTIQKVLASIAINNSHHEIAIEAQKMAQLSLERAMEEIKFDVEKEILTQKYNKLFQS
ncbi:DUF2254 domain-containing protein [Pasteurellaceae bacterium 22721_9_1]